MSQNSPTIKTRCGKCRKIIDTKAFLLHKLRGPHAFKCPHCKTKVIYTLKIEIEKVLKLKT